MTRHLGNFILNVLKPLIEETDRMLSTCEHLRVDGDDVIIILEETIELTLKRALINAVTYIILGGMFCWSVWFILK